MKKTNNYCFDICIITTIHEPYDSRINKQINSLSKEGFSVMLIAPWENISEKIECKFIYRKMPIKIHERIINAIRIFLLSLNVNSRCYLFHDIDFILFALIIKFIKQVPVIYDCRENYPEEIKEGKEWVPNLLRPILSYLAKLIENWAVRIFDAVITVAPYQISRFSKVGAKCIMLRNFANRQIKPYLSHDSGILYIGSLSKNYGLDILLNIGRELKKRKSPFPLIIADRFGRDNKIRDKFIKIIEEEKMPVKIEPSVLPIEIDRLLTKGSVGLFVANNTKSKNIALPMKLFEYMAAGMPIIASDLNMTRHIIEEAKCGILVSPDDAKGYVDAATHIMSSLDIYNDLRKKGFEAIMKKYNWEEEASELIFYIKRLLKFEK
jgi:glycosyltransferase involved in cell wall biosynthesis